MRTHRYAWTLAAALLASCGSYGAPDEVLYGEAVYTQPKPDADFGSLTSYWLDPEVKVVEDDGFTLDVLPQGVQDTIHANMQALGYTRLGTLAEAAAATGGVALKASVLKGTGAVYYPGYWCDYWYYYSCYYDWYYAGSYKFGTVILEMGDVEPESSAPPDGRLPILWVSAIYGVASTPVYDVPRVQNGVNRAFAQSPYLRTN